MKIIITGANGFIGRHMMTALQKRGYEVLGIDLRTSKNKNIVRCDITSPKLADYINKGDKVLHLAAVATFGGTSTNPRVAIKTNILGVLNVVRACIEKGAERLVFSSSGAVYSKDIPDIPILETSPIFPPSLYGITKKAGEDIIVHYSKELPYVILRYAYIYGQGKEWGAIGSFLKLIKAGKSPKVFGGEQAIDFTYIKDIVAATILALETENVNEAFNIGSGRAVKIRYVCNYCIKALNSDIKPEFVASRKFDSLLFLYDITKAKKLLGFKPKWRLFSGIRDMLNYPE